MSAGGFGMIADGQCPCRRTDNGLWGRIDAAQCRLGVSSYVLLRHTPASSCGSYIQLDTEHVDAA